MKISQRGIWATVLAVASGLAIAVPAAAGVPLTWASIRASHNQVALVSARGQARSAASPASFNPEDTLTTGAQARAEVLFNEGSLLRIGEQTSLNFWPDHRLLRLSQGTAAVFVPPGQGRTVVETPTTRIGLNSNGVVVRYVPSRGLTLVMALANPLTGPVSVSTAISGQDLALYAGQMALIGTSDIQIVEFDLREFYQSSPLMADLHIGNGAYRPAHDEPLAALRPELRAALDRQTPFTGDEEILNPALIGNL
jgi:hypothetical protein